MPGQLRIRWSSLHNLQGYLVFRGGAEGSFTSGISGVDATFLLGELFFLVFFFFFLATWLLKFKVSPGEVEDEDAAVGEEGEGSTLEPT